MINTGVIGLGYWGPNLVRNLMNADSIKLTSCADNNPDRVEKVRRLYPHLQFYSEGEELITGSNVDAVAIATPVSSHHKLAKAALEAGKHVLVEKPLTQNVEQAQKLVDLSEKNNLTLMVDHTFLYNGAVEKMKDLVDSGELGEIVYFDSVRINLGLFQHDVNVVWDLAIHDVSILDYLFDGQQPEVVSSAGIALPEFGKECTAYATLKYPNGAVGSIHVSWFAPVKIRRFIICGTKKMVVYDDLDPFARLKIYDKGVEFYEDPNTVHQMLVSYRTGDMVAPVLDNTEPLKKMCQDFISAVEGVSRTRISADGAVRIVKVLEAISSLLPQP